MAAHPILHHEPHVSQYREGTCCGDPRCRVRFGGYLRVGRLQGLDCDQPMRILRSCGALDVTRCNNHRESKCGPCSWRYRRLITRVAECSPAGGFLYLLTLTAPGRDQHRMPSGDICPCTPEGGVNLAEWNPTASARWNRMRGQLRRLEPELQYMRAVETQGRGALHLHVIVWSPVQLDKRPMRAMAIRYGFGHEVDLAFIEPGSRKHAYYVAKYVTKACDQRTVVPWVADVADEETGEIRRLVVDARYRTWSASRGWGVTVRQIRAIHAEQRRKRAEEVASVAPPSVEILTPGDPEPAGLPGPPG